MFNNLKLGPLLYLLVGCKFSSLQHISTADARLAQSPIATAEKQLGIKMQWSAGFGCIMQQVMLTQGTCFSKRCSH